MFPVNPISVYCFIWKVKMKWLIPLILLTLSSVVWAGTGDHKPESDVTVEWTKGLCALGHYQCVSDGIDANTISVYDNVQNGVIDIFEFDDTAITDSTVDSVRYGAYWKDSGGTSDISAIDSLDGYARRTTQFGGDGDATYAWDYLYFTTSPAGAAWTWTDIDNIIAGVEATSVPNNKSIYVTEFSMRVYYSYTADGETFRRRRNLAGGNQ
jgi:hypothetical protein